MVQKVLRRRLRFAHHFRPENGPGVKAGCKCCFLFLCSARPNTRALLCENILEYTSDERFASLEKREYAGCKARIRSYRKHQILHIGIVSEGSMRDYVLPVCSSYYHIHPLAPQAFGGFPYLAIFIDGDEHTVIHAMQRLTTELAGKMKQDYVCTSSKLVQGQYAAARRCREARFCGLMMRVASQHAPSEILSVQVDGVGTILYCLRMISVFSTLGNARHCRKRKKKKSTVDCVTLSMISSKYQQ